MYILKSLISCQDGEGITEAAVGFIGTLAPEATAASERSDVFGGESVSYQASSKNNSENSKNISHSLMS